MYKVLLVNSLTTVRIILSILFGHYLSISDNRLGITIVLFIMICLTDFLDGKAARWLDAGTKFGAVYDVIADLFFLILSYYQLITYNALPAWMLIVVLLKFIEFCTSSLIFKRISVNISQVFLFDKIGRAAVLLFYILPIVVILMEHYAAQPVLTLITYIYCIAVTAMSVISSLYRVRMCLCI